MEIIAGILPAIQTPLVNKFYQAHKARGKATRQDQNWVLKSTEIIAACRVQCVAGSDLLSTVLVVPEHRGKGLARQLLVAVLAQQHTPLFTFAYRHLATFYAGLGFEEIEPEELPQALAEKYHTYVAQGRKLQAMQYIKPDKN
ncbi:MULTISPECIES: GNAT family N-acetyltransferase [unclassified Pseudoalteromonas]|uniref:GNAT family N-acetyltransferase n=1 Tax=unclassified Pseudoalteromonas TaxID=194690 RepID=UPI00209847C6|nr:GNAT family N-acetyltransferase [Pseudoalteromonas sp. XMcav2-N]MCO7189703.1 GNAT family N-acetyltransferase [Pseudoalteromonas sp. XMcav2-N]